MHPASTLAVIPHWAIIKNVTMLMDSPKSRLRRFFFPQNAASNEMFSHECDHNYYLIQYVFGERRECNLFNHQINNKYPHSSLGISSWCLFVTNIKSTLVMEEQ